MKHESDILKQIKNYFMRRKNAAEAYEFEREIEKDPFLYEAVEGFEGMHVPDMQQALDELDMLVDQKAKAGVFENINWKVAATVLAVIVGGATLITLGLNYNSTPAVADEDNSGNQYEPRIEQMEYTTIPDSIHIISFDVSEDTMAIAATEVESVQSLAMNDTESKSLKEDKPELSNKLTEKSKKPEVAGNAKDSSLENYDEAVVLNEIVVAEEALENVESKSLSMAPEELNRMPISYASEEITAAKSTKESAAAQPAPSVGSAAYKKYIASNLKKSEEMKTGTVTLSFEFDRNGNPKKINVDKSLCDACDQEAIRLIENGPAWNAEDRKTRVTYTISIP